MKKNSCPSCGASIETGSDRCEYCGSVLVYASDSGTYSVESVRCPKCGTQNRPNAAYCANCSQKLLDTCMNCGAKISIVAMHCTRCGASHNMEDSDTEDSDLPKLKTAVALSNGSQYAEANDMFETLEPTHRKSAEFYAAWILNYQRWATSMDNDSTMHSFAAAYRTRARDLLASSEKLFPESQEIQKARCEVEENTRIKPIKKSSGCFIATAVYGSEDCEEIDVLRNWRDKILMKTHYGPDLVRMYYITGPKMARFLHKSPYVKRAVRYLIDMFVAIIRRAGKK